MNKKIIVTITAVLSILMLLVISSCASKKTPTSTDTEATSTSVPVNTATATVTNTTGTGLTPTATQTPTSLYNFDSSLQGWTVSNYSNPPNDGELGITNAITSTAQVYAGSGAVELTCNFTGDLGASTSAKGAFKLDLSASPANLTGKTIVFHVYVPTELTQAPYNSTPYGAKVYIKTGASWTWADGGWNNLLTPGWNTFTFAPSGVGEADTREVGIQIGKGTGTPDWSGNIYVDEVNW